MSQTAWIAWFTDAPYKIFQLPEQSDEIFAHKSRNYLADIFIAREYQGSTCRVPCSEDFLGISLGEGSDE